MPQDRWERIRGGLYGLLIGDALGVPYEFTSSENIPERHFIEMSPPDDFVRAHRSVPAGTWSDDGAQALVLLDSLTTCASLDLKRFTDGLLAWYRTGFMTTDGHVFDIGIQTMQGHGHDCLHRWWVGGHTLWGAGNSRPLERCIERSNHR